MAITSVMHTAISTADLEASVEFWQAMGFAESRRWQWSPGQQVVNELLDLADSAAQAALLEGHGTGIELFEFWLPDPGRIPEPLHRIGYTHMAFSTDDLSAEMERLAALGMTFWADPVEDPSGRKMVYGRSPEGLAMELVQPAARSGSPGVVC